MASRTYQAEVALALGQAVEAVVEENTELASTVRNMKRKVVGMSRSISGEWFVQTHNRQKSVLMGYVREVELVEILDGIFKIARRIARS